MKHDKVRMKDRRYLVHWQPLNKSLTLVAGFHDLETATKYASFLWQNFRWLFAMQITDQIINKVVWSKERQFEGSTK